jgi:membrane-bound acyltransferase YfiQ involved in biofilm formation
MVIGALLTLACVVHRPMFNLNPLHAFVYFLPVYLLGIWASIHKEWLLPWLEKHVLYLLAGGLLFSALQTGFSPVVGNYHKYLFQTAPLDLNLPGKICFIGVIMVGLRRLEHRNIPLLNAIADYSFPIYFLHSMVLDLIDRRSLWPFSDNFPQVLLLTVFLMGASVALAALIKFLFGKTSRYIIGY